MITKGNFKKSEDDFLIENLSRIIEPVAHTFGSYCELVLHDLRHLETSIVKIAHGHITGRSPGGSVTDLGLKTIKENMTDDVWQNYKTTSKNGRVLKSTTILFRNRKKVPIAALCINLDVSELTTGCSFLNELCQFNEAKTEITETFETDINNTIKSMIDQVIANYHISVSAMKKKDRVNIVARLEEQGAFQVKGTVKMVAKELNVSKYAIYSYLEEVKSTHATAVNSK